MHAAVIVPACALAESTRRPAALLVMAYATLCWSTILLYWSWGTTQPDSFGNPIALGELGFVAVFRLWQWAKEPLQIVVCTVENSSKLGICKMNRPSSCACGGSCPVVSQNSVKLNMLCNHGVVNATWAHHLVQLDSRLVADTSRPLHQLGFFARDLFHWPVQFLETCHLTCCSVLRQRLRSLDGELVSEID